MFHRVVTYRRHPTYIKGGGVDGGESPRLGGQFKTWHRLRVEDLRESGAIEGSTELSPRVFGVETAQQEEWQKTRPRECGEGGGQQE